MEKKSRNWTKWLYWFCFAVAVIVVYKTLDNFGEIASSVGNFLDILMPFLIGILISYILYLPCRKIETGLMKVKKVKWIAKKARFLSVMIVYIIAILLIIMMFTFIIPPVIKSVIDLTNNFQGYYDMAMNTIQNMPEDSFLKNEVIMRVIHSIQSIDLKEILNIEMLTQYAQGAISLANGIINTFVAIIVSAYILIDRRSIIGFFKRLAGATLNPKMYQNIDKYFNRSNTIFFNFLASQIIDAFVVGIITSIGMSILGVKYAVLLGFMIGLFNVIPYVGAIIAVVIAGIITFFTGGLQQAIWMLVIVIVLQQIDANIINPRIIGNSLKVNPLLVIFAITIGGAYFGMLGIFLSVPIVAVIKLLIDDFIEYRSRRQKIQEKTE